VLRRFALLVGIDARRPASWLAAATGLAAAALLPAALPVGWPSPPLVSAALGGLLAAIGAGQAPAAREAAGPACLTLAARICWPLAGWLGAAAVRGDCWLAASGGLGICAAGVVVAACARRDLLPADAATAAILVAAGAAALGWWAEGGGPAGVPGRVVGCGALCAAAFVAAAWGGGRPAAWATPPRQRARRVVTTLAMAAALGGMVGWLFLAPECAPLDLVASLGWFIALAVPAATLGDGVSHARLWRRAERAAPAAPGLGALGPGRRRDALQAALTTAAILGWPPLVAAVVGGLDGGGAWPAAAVVAALGAAATLLGAACLVGEALTASPDTQQALVLAGCVVAVVVAAAGAPGLLPFPAPG